MPSKIYGLYLIFFFIRLLTYRYLRLNFFSAAEFSFINQIFAVDKVHFTGGGNINSLDRGWLYYSLIVIMIAKFFYKKVILTSQTIGPFSFFDIPFVFIILNLTDLIAIRQPQSNLKKYLIFNPTVKTMLDSAYQPNHHPASTKNQVLTIGLSLHSQAKINFKLFNETLSGLFPGRPVQIILIPHIIGNNCDLEYMSSQIKLPSNFKITVPRIDSSPQKQTLIPEIIKNITAKCDITINSRYHAIIYSLSANIPTIGLYRGFYYQIKNYNALKFIYPNPHNYLINLDNNPSLTEMNTKIETILLNLKNEKDYLTKFNNQFSNTYDLFYNNINGRVLPA